ncbi:MAG: ComEC/Rec2 family competence protein [Lachnospiraceae bacterium]|nr:ComEC/Rec2 family competence protein [Lachnospiraceae bacterium]
MIGKRVIRLKGPAVLCAAAFVIGIVSAEVSAALAVGSAVGVFGLCVLFLRSLQKGKRRSSAMDKVLFLIPFCLLSGFFIMSREKAVYEQNRQIFSSCMTEGKEVLAEGTISYIGRTASGVRLELKGAAVASYRASETVYRPVGKLIVYTEDTLAENGELKYGQRIFVYGKGSEFEAASNPGGFDARAYYFSLGITGAIQGKTLRIEDFSYHRLNQALFQAKYKLLESYVTYLGEDNAGIVSSMLLGERSLLSDETQELYRQGGISHVLAISGLHVSLIGMALYEFLRKTILGRNGAIPVACVAVLLYGTFVNAGTSTKRAVIMFLLLLLATALGRTYDTLSAMSVSGVVILCQSPGALYTASFQLSFAAAYGASVLAAVLKERRLEETGNAKKVFRGKRRRKENDKWKKWKMYMLDKCKSMLLFGLAIQVVTFPFTVFHFFEYSTYGFMLNPIIVPLMTILLLCGFLSGVCGLFVPWLGHFFAGGTGGILWIYDGLCRLVQKLPGSLLLFGKPELWQMIVYFVILAVCVCVWKNNGCKEVQFSGKYRGRLQNLFGNAKVILGILLILPFCLLPTPCGPFEAVFLDVGQGDGILLRERGGAVFLVDGGSSDVQKVGEKRMIPYLKSQGIRTIDCAFVSHTDSDHISGLREILTAMPEHSGKQISAEPVPDETKDSGCRMNIWGYKGTPMIKKIVLPRLYGTEYWPGSDSVEKMEKSEDWGKKDAVYEELEELAKRKGVEVYYMGAGDYMKVGEKLIVSCLAPEDGVTYLDKNAASMVLQVSYEAFDLLLTGDMDKDGENRLLERWVKEKEKVDMGELGEKRAEKEMVDKGMVGTEVHHLRREIEVLKVSHHGSNTASSEAFLESVNPQIAVISCGKRNRYGHPHKETLERLYGVKCEVHRTDKNGCVTIKVKKGGKYEVNGWLETE